MKGCIITLLSFSPRRTGLLPMKCTPEQYEQFQAAMAINAENQTHRTTENAKSMILHKQKGGVSPALESQKYNLIYKESRRTPP